MAKTTTKSKTRKITTASILAALSTDAHKDISVMCGEGENAVEILVKKRLSLHERIAMVDDIVDMMFLENENGESVYYPALRKFSIEYAIVNYFTDIALPADGDKARYFLEETGIADVVAGAVSDGYITEILTEAEEAIEYRKQIIAKRSKLDAILDSVVDVAQTISKKTEGIELPQIMEFVQKNAPEFKSSLEKLLANEKVDAPTE